MLARIPEWARNFIIIFIGIKWETEDVLLARFGVM